MVSRREGQWAGRAWEVGTEIYTVLCLQQAANEELYIQAQQRALLNVP